MSRTTTNRRARELTEAFWRQDDAPLRHDIQTKLNGLRDEALTITAQQCLLGQTPEEAVAFGVLRWQSVTHNEPPTWLSELLLQLAEFVHSTEAGS